MNYRGLYVVGDKRKGSIRAIQVVDEGSGIHSLSIAEYVARGFEPNYKTLPWEEDIKPRAAAPKV